MKKHYHEIKVDLSTAHDYLELPTRGRSMYVKYCDGIAYMALQQDVSDIIRLYRGMVIDFAGLPIEKVYIINSAQSSKRLELAFFERGGYLVSPDSALGYNYQQKSVIDGRAFAVTNITTLANEATYSVYIGAVKDITISRFSVTATDDVETIVYKDPLYSGGTDSHGVCLDFANGTDTENTIKLGTSLTGGDPILSFINSFQYDDGIFIPKGHGIGIKVSNDLGSSVDYAFFIAYTL